jgi:hypothetical protein
VHACMDYLISSQCTDELESWFDLSFWDVLFPGNLFWNVNKFSMNLLLNFFFFLPFGFDRSIDDAEIIKTGTTFGRKNGAVFC